MKKENILILAAHPDDGEFGCGASLHKLSRKYEIHYAAFSPCIKSLPTGAKETILFEELKNATKHKLKIYETDTKNTLNVYSNILNIFS